MFYDGPPFATGTPHYGHIAGNLIKDAIPRYWTMRGFRVERKWGWDCHGLPIENIVEKEMGSKSKKDIEKIGVDKFNEQCRSKVLKYVEEWKKTIRRLGRWADMENCYKTMDLDFMESVWWVFKQLYDKGLIYEGYRSMHICPRCETTLSQSEVAEGYRDIKDLSATVKFRIKYAENKTGRGVGAIIINNKNEILLIRRNEPNRKITWALPGGKVENNETFLNALKREIDEELGVKIKSAKAFSSKPDILEGRVFETVCYEIKIKGTPKIMIPDEIDKLEWFSLDNLPKIDYPPSKDAIDIYQNEKEKFYLDVNIDRPLSNIYILAWTTTPWTLLGNVALAIGKNIKYAVVKIENDFYILAKDRIEEVLKDKEYEFVADVNSEDLIGLKYEPTFGYLKKLIDDGKTARVLKKNNSNEGVEPQFAINIDSYSKDEFKQKCKEIDKSGEIIFYFKRNAYRIYEADFVNTDEGTGVVHIAPAFGDDDMNLAKKENLPFVQHVNADGRFNEDVIAPPEKRKNIITDQFIKNYEEFIKSAKDESESERVGKWIGREVKPKKNPSETDIEIVKYLARENLLFAKKKYEHSYPHCWRCDSPLLNYATSSWFVNILKIKKRMLELAEDINWSPEHIKKGRWGKWLEGARDWSISRQRFWASVIPIWRCNNESKVKSQKSKVNCNNIKVMGSIDELEKLSNEKITDLHKHTVDKITFKCEKCGGEMKRVPDVLDCWFESGSMPYAQAHYPFENREKFEKNFPAEFIGEGADQTRCWFYYLHAIATGIKDSAAFKNVIVNGIVLAEDGMKMSKKLQNYPKPDFLFEKYSGDALRYYLLSSPVMLADTLCFAEQGVQEAMRKNIMLLWNVVKF